MKRLRNLSVRGKIALIVASGIVFQIAIAATGIYYLDAANQSLARTVEVEAEAIRQAARVRAEFLDLIVTEKDMLMSADGAERARFRLAFDAGRQELEDKLAALGNTLGSRGQGHYTAFSQHYRAYLDAHQRIRELLQRDEVDGARQHSIGRAREHIDRARAAVVDLMDELDTALGQRKSANDANSRAAMGLMLGVLLATLLIALIAGLVVTRAITAGLGNMVAVADAIAKGKLDNRIDTSGSDEVARLASSVAEMQTALRAAHEQSEAQSWLKTGIGRLNDVMRGELDIDELGVKIISEISTYLGAQVGAFYVLRQHDGQDQLGLHGSYAYTKRKNLSNRFAVGEGLVGQAALEKQQILIRNVPEDYLRVTSGLGEALPRFICVTPFLYEDEIKGVVEIGTLAEMTDLQLEYLSQAMPAVAITLVTAQGREELAHSLERSQQLTEELQTQQEELEAANEEMEEQTQALKQSEERLKAQQEEMEVINEELEEKNELLERQKNDVEKARREIADKAEDLALASKYKSEFLANMSHELRTPLNSLLILARVFAENRDGNLTDEQVESARVIYNSGTDLLGLINDILDLAKVEAGRMDLQLGEVSLRSLATGIEESFEHIAADKGLELAVAISPEAPAAIQTDEKRLDQILKNLVSNAIKFTEQGTVAVVLGEPAELHGAGGPREGIAIRVRDTGIGIAAAEQKVIFEAFQQADGGTDRRFGGTGLGLSITRELVHLLGGRIALDSQPGQGSTFTVVLPARPEQTQPMPAAARSAPAPAAAEKPERPRPTARFEVEAVEDDRDAIEQGDMVILIIDDDPAFARLLGKQCRAKGFKSLIAPTGEEGLKLASQHLPLGIVLDLKLPGMDGWSVLEVLKDDPCTRHIPVHIMSVEPADMTALKKGAVGFLTKPLAREQIDAAFQKIASVSSQQVRRVLVVEDDAGLRRGLVDLIADSDVQVVEAASGGQTIEALRSTSFDCVVLDLGLPDMDGTELLKTLEADQEVAVPPVIVHTGRDISREEEMELRTFSESIIIKDVRSEERLMDEVSLFLHRVVEDLPDRKRKMITDLHDVDRLFKGKKVLIVDDDMRTAFALAKILNAKGVETIKAENGAKALRLLDENPDVDLVLMDIMMPVMDGYEAMRRIRAQDRFDGLPIIALTAKAMMGDQELCIQAGASDYLPKPLDENRLYSMMRVWLYR